MAGERDNAEKPSAKSLFIHLVPSSILVSQIQYSNKWCGTMISSHNIHRAQIISRQTQKPLGKILAIPSLFPHNGRHRATSSPNNIRFLWGSFTMGSFGFKMNVFSKRDQCLWESPVREAVLLHMVPLDSAIL